MWVMLYNSLSTQTGRKKPGPWSSPLSRIYAGKWRKKTLILLRWSANGSTLVLSIVTSIAMHWIELWMRYGTQIPCLWTPQVMSTTVGFTTWSMMSWTAPRSLRTSLPPRPCLRRARGRWFGPTTLPAIRIVFPPYLKANR